MLEPNRLKNQKRGRFKVLRLEWKSNCDDVIINIVINSNKNKGIKFVKINKKHKS